MLDRAFTPSAPNVAWSADVTSLPTAEGWLFLAVMEDPFSRRIVNRSMDAAMTSRLVVNPWSLVYTISVLSNWPLSCRCASSRATLSSTPRAHRRYFFRSRWYAAFRYSASGSYGSTNMCWPMFRRAFRLPTDVPY